MSSLSALSVCCVTSQDGYVLKSVIFDIFVSFPLRGSVLNSSYSQTLIIRTSIVRISRLSGLFSLVPILS